MDLDLVLVNSSNLHHVPICRLRLSGSGRFGVSSVEARFGVKEERDEADVFADRLELLLEAAASDVTEKLSQPLTEASDARQRRHQRRQD